MARSVKLWEGRTDDTKAPPRVRLRVFERFKGRCHACGRAIQVGEKWTLEHLVALINGGRNAEDNLCLTCCNCLPAKNAADVAEKSKLATIRKKHRDVSKPKRNWGRRPFSANTFTPRQSSKCFRCGEYLDGCTCANPSAPTPHRGLDR